MTYTISNKTNSKLRLTNTLSGSKELFKPIIQKQISIYCCGVTVYDLCHLGHARSYIAWDVLRRYLIWSGYKVTFIQNFTDIDDKIINKANQEGCSMKEISERNINEFHQDMNQLGILRPDRMPRATQCLDEIRLMIEELQSKGAAYAIDGDVYFAVTKHNEYGKLSNRELNDQELNADGRITRAEETKKQHPFDFALWKGAKENEPSFPSPWGAGRPGWHIECSAMVKAELGNTIDIHLGGADLIFPHHENEIAQSEAATGKQLARYWLHNGMVNVNGEKMSKSLGNFTTIRAILSTGISPMALRLFVLQAHYRKPLDFTKDALNAAATGWKSLNKALCLGAVNAKELEWPPNSHLQDIDNAAKASTKEELYENYKQRFIDYMNDDINTSGALAVLFELARPLKTLSNCLEIQGANVNNESEHISLFFRWKLLVELASVIGLKAEKLEDKSSNTIRTKKDVDIKKAINLRKEAKQAGNYEKADQIRNDLNKIGIRLIDKPGGITEWTQN